MDLTESSSESEGERPNCRYRHYMDKLLENSVSHENPPTSSPDKRDFQSVEEEDVSAGESLILSDGLVDEQGDNDSEDGSKNGNEIGLESIPGKRRELLQPQTVSPLQRSGSKRKVKPVIRLTYDEPGKAKDHPITIVHRGIVIKVG